ncbi:hypothetical protein VTK26DRAFT_7007 [Humicola hyalothermophila]
MSALHGRRGLGCWFFDRALPRQPAASIATLPLALTEIAHYLHTRSAQLSCRIRTVALGWDGSNDRIGCPAAGAPVSGFVGLRRVAYLV